MALAIAATIERPRPAPPSRGRERRRRARSARRSDRAPPGDAAPLVGDLDHEVWPSLSDAARSLVVSVYFTAFSSRASSAMRTLPRRRGAAVGDLPSRQPRGDLGPAHEDVLEERLDVDGAGRQEVGPSAFASSSRRAMIRSIGRARRARRRARTGRLGHRCQELEMAAGDRHRRAQLVRDVVKEALLPSRSEARLVGERLDVSSARPGAARARPSPGTSPTSAGPRTARPRAGPGERVGENRGAGRERRPRRGSPSVTASDQTRNPYRSVRLIQTKWNGIVSQLGQSDHRADVRGGEHGPATSTSLRSQAIARISNRLDRSVGAELLAQAAHADVDDVGAGIEAIAPDVGEQAFRLTTSPRGERGGGAAGTRGRTGRRQVRRTTLTPGEVERQPPPHARLTRSSRPVLAEVHANPRDQLVERERLRQVVGAPELEAPQLRRQIRSGGEDEHRQGRPLLGAVQSTRDRSSRGSSRSSTRRSTDCRGRARARPLRPRRHRRE